MAECSILSWAKNNAIPKKALVEVKSFLEEEEEELPHVRLVCSQMASIHAASSSSTLSIPLFLSFFSPPLLLVSAIATAFS